MKTCEQRAQDVLQRRDEYVRNRRKRVRRIALGSLCGVLAAGLMWQMLPRLLPNDGVSPAAAKDYEAVWDRIETAIEKSDDRGADYVDSATGEIIEVEPFGGSVSDKLNMNTPATRPTTSKGPGVTDTVTGTATPDFSDTNLQVVGVQEADCIKTDGKYIYALSTTKGQLSIVSVDNGKLALASQLAVEEGYCSGMYVNQNRLIVERSIKINNRQEIRILLDIYDITDRAAPKRLNTYGQSGTLVSTRMIGNILYLVTSYTVGMDAAKDDVATYVPKVYEEEAVQCLPVEDIVINESCDDACATYLVISGFDTQAIKQISQKSLLGYGGTLYCSTENLYVANTVTLDDSDAGSLSGTKLYRFSLDNGVVSPAAEGTVAGTLLNQFSMDEYEGHLRLVATLDGMKQTVNGGIVSVQMGTKTQTLYVLNDQLEVVGSVKNLAPDERVYSVRFDGNIGYFVTFRQTDPLFAADLSDPTNPKILSALKIPGFSEYLHPYADGLLLGLGRDADENGIQSGCVKLSMFDVSDPAAVTEAQTLVLEDCFYSDAENDHKAILVNADRNLIAFPGSGGDYHIYGYSAGEGFIRRAVIGGFSDNHPRGLYIGEYFYVISVRQISSYRLDTFTPVHELSLTKS